MPEKPAPSNKLATLAICAGSSLGPSSARPVAPAVHVAAVSYFDDSEQLDRSLDGHDFVYTRINAQNTVLLEEAVSALERAEASVAYASGMAALHAVLESQPLKRGDRVVMPADGYGATRALFKQSVAQKGAELHALFLSRGEALERVRALKPRLVLAESVTNPLLSVVDLPALVKVCRDVGATLAVDSTFPSPIHQQPIALGADYAIQSTTKWINGHSDAMGGIVSGSLDRIAPLRANRLLQGPIIGPFEAFLTLRGVRTLPVRMKQHSENALRVAQRLVESPLLERVIYPGLPSSADHAVAKRVLTGGFGGMLAFELKGATRPQAFKFLENLRIGRPAPSLGDVATLVMHAASASARRLTPQERETAGIRENLIRVSVGLEDPDDIAEDLIRAANASASRTP